VEARGVADRVVGALGREIDFDLDNRTHEALRLVRDFIYDETGNRFEDHALYLLKRRLDPL